MRIGKRHGHACRLTLVRILVLILTFTLPLTIIFIRTCGVQVGAIIFLVVATIASDWMSAKKDLGRAWK